MAQNRLVGHVGDIGIGTKTAVEPQVFAAASGDLVSIIIPCCGMIEYTKLCVPSVLRFTRPPFELIFLDIGSLDGTAEYLAGIKAATTVRVEIIRTVADLGIPEACKEAITAARGDYLVLLNNDTVVTDAWVQQMLNLVTISPAMGMVGPMSNYAPLSQRVETVSYRVKPKRGKAPQRFGFQETLLDVTSMHAFAREYREKTKGKWREVQELGGFCLLLKREVLQRIGLPLLEKWTDLSLFDTDILSVKARQVGYTLACCHDVFVHHFGTRTFSHGAPTNSTKSKEMQGT